ncbi:MAG TPA: phosphatase PAP2 family protein [Solirubrobacteraceae bacterium]
MSSTVSIDTNDPVAEMIGAVPAAVSGLTEARAQRSRTRTRWWIEAAVIVWLCWVYDAVTNLAPLRLHIALAHATSILRVERSLHLDPEHALDHWLAGHHTLGLVLSDYYDNAHFIVTLGLLGGLWWRRADLYRPLRNSLVLVNVLAFVVFWLYPVAPPRMLGGFTDVVASTHAFGSWHTGALASHANQLAAMPSLHMAWAAWCALALWRISRRRWVRAAALLYPCMTALAVLATGNHFLLDVLGGLVAIAAAVALTEVFMGLATRLRGPRVANTDRSVLLPAYRVSQTCYEVPDQVD